MIAFIWEQIISRLPRSHLFIGEISVGGEIFFPYERNFLGKRGNFMSCQRNFKKSIVLYFIVCVHFIVLHNRKRTLKWTQKIKYKTLMEIYIRYFTTWYFLTNRGKVVSLTEEMFIHMNQTENDIMLKGFPANRGNLFHMNSS